MIRLTPLRRFALYTVAVGIFVSGAAMLIFHYFLRLNGPFGPEANPGEQWARIAHGCFAAGSLWLMGMMWERHITKAWGRSYRRTSGLFLVAILLALIVTGLMLYYVGNEELQATSGMVHWAIGLVAPIAFVLHRLARARAVASNASAREPNIPR